MARQSRALPAPSFFPSLSPSFANANKKPPSPFFFCFTYFLFSTQRSARAKVVNTVTPPWQGARSPPDPAEPL